MDHRIEQELGVAGLVVLHLIMEMVEQEDLIDLRSYVVDRVEAVHCILEYGRDLRTTYHAHVFLWGGYEVDGPFLAAGEDYPSPCHGCRWRQKAQYGERGRALSRSRLSDDGQTASFVHTEGETVQGLDRALRAWVADAQIVDEE